MPNEEVLVEILECEQNTQIAHLILNSPETLNSLTLNMVNLISDLLNAWEQDPQIKMILISGSGEKAFWRAKYTTLPVDLSQNTTFLAHDEQWSGENFITKSRSQGEKG